MSTPQTRAAIRRDIIEIEQELQNIEPKVIPPTNAVLVDLSTISNKNNKKKGKLWLKSIWQE